MAGHFIDSLLAIIFGQVRYLFPILLIVVGILIIKDLEYEYRPTHLFGSILFFLSFNGLVHLLKPLEQMNALAMQGYGGGLFGAALAWPLLKYVGYWGGLTILIGLLLVSIIFLFNTTLAELVALHKNSFLLLGWGGRQIVSFFNLFKKSEAVKFKIKGDYEAGSTENSNEEMEDPVAAEEEDQRILKPKPFLSKKATNRPRKNKTEKKRKKWK